MSGSSAGLGSTQLTWPWDGAARSQLQQQQHRAFPPFRGQSGDFWGCVVNDNLAVGNGIYSFALFSVSFSRYVPSTQCEMLPLLKGLSH